MRKASNKGDDDANELDPSIDLLNIHTAWVSLSLDQIGFSAESMLY